MEPVLVTVFVAVILVIIGLNHYFSKKAVIKRKLKNTPVKNINYFRDGEEGRIIGEIEFAEKPLKAPLSGRECAMYHVLVEQNVSSGKSSHWKTIIDEKVSNKFLIRDGLNHAFINSGRVKSYLVQDSNFRSGFLNDATEILEQYLNDHGIESENMLGFNKTIRYKEGVYSRGERVAVCGKGIWRSATSLKLPEEYGTVLEITAPEDSYIYLSDDPDSSVE